MPKGWQDGRAPSDALLGKKHLPHGAFHEQETHAEQRWSAREPAQAGCGKHLGVLILMTPSGLDARVWGP